MITTLWLGPGVFSMWWMRGSRHRDPAPGLRRYFPARTRPEVCFAAPFRFSGAAYRAQSKPGGREARWAGVFLFARCSCQHGPAVAIKWQLILAFSFLLGAPEPASSGLPGGLTTPPCLEDPAPALPSPSSQLLGAAPPRGQWPRCRKPFAELPSPPGTQHPSSEAGTAPTTLCKRLGSARPAAACVPKLRGREAPAAGQLSAPFLVFSAVVCFPHWVRTVLGIR